MSYFANGPAQPISPCNGMIWFDPAANRLMFYDSGKWKYFPHQPAHVVGTPDDDYWQDICDRRS